VQQKAGENAYEIFENAIAGSGGRQSRNVLEDSQELLKGSGQMGEAKEWKYRLTHKDAFAGVMPEVECMLSINPGYKRRH